MNANDWRTLIGPDALEYITSKAADEETVAKILSRAVEAGFRAHEGHPTVSPTRTKMLWPRDDDRVMPVLTAEGLLRAWEGRGHGFVLLRVPQLVRACAGPFLGWLQVLLHAYEEQCEIDGVEPLAVDWRVFVGGSLEAPGVPHGQDYATAEIQRLCPEPRPVQRAYFAGSGATKK